MPFPLAHDDPQQLGDYRLVARLGSGGMGTVYLARSAGGRTVAVKTMHPRIAADPEFRTRFRLEVDAARVIGGECGASVVDAEPLSDTPWLATEYVLGPPLDEAVELSGALPVACVRLMGAGLCEALRRLHGSDVVHRDLKPSNILLTAFGPKVIDFGIARAIGDDRLTRTGAAAGTPAFMSPEQATGQEHTSAGDVFALAGVLVFALTGRGPFGSGQAADLLYRVRYGEPDLSGVPEELLPLLQRCLAKDPEARLDTTELAAQLREQSTEFADTLPGLVLADISRRCARAFETLPERLPVPKNDAETEPSPGPPTVSRRKMLALSAGGTLSVAAAGYAAWSLTSNENPATGPDPDAASGATSRPANVPPKATWELDVSEVNILNAPRAVGPLVLAFSDDGLLGINAKSGKKQWTIENMYGFAMTTDGHRLYAVDDTVATGELTVSQMNIKRGSPGSAVVRTTELNGSDTTLLAATEDTLFLVSRKGTSADFAKGWHILGFDIGSGKERWSRPIAQTMPGDGDTNLYAAVSGNHLFMIRDGSVGVRDTRTGELLWSKKVPREEYDMSKGKVQRGQFALSETHAYVGSGEVLALRLGDGEISWRFGKKRKPTGEGFEEGERRYGPPSVRDGVVYAAEGRSGFVALDADSGKLLWEEEPAGLPPEFDSAPVVGTKYVYGTVDSRRWITAVGLEEHASAWAFTGPGSGGLARSAIEHRDAEQLVIASGNTILAVPLE